MKSQHRGENKKSRSESQGEGRSSVLILTHKGFPGDSAGKESACKAGDLGSAPGLGRSPREGKGHPLQDSTLENPMDCPCGRKESDTTERLSRHFQHLPEKQPCRVFKDQKGALMHPSEKAASYSQKEQCEPS